MHRRIVALVAEITRLEGEPKLFVAQFWLDFYGAMLTHTVRSAMTKLLLLVVALLIIPQAHAATNSHLNLVVAIDLTKSVAVKGPDGTTEFQKNVDGVTKLLGQVQADPHVTVIGITDHSFAQPYILLSGTIPNDAGYFGERLSAARKELVRVWKTRNAHLQPSFAATDILGALLLASQIFNQQSPSGEQRALVIFSDMRNHTRDLDLESEVARAAHNSTEKSSEVLSVDLHRVQVCSLGVDGAGQTTEYWRWLSEFWAKYLHQSGGTLSCFSVLRALPTGQATP